MGVRVYECVCFCMFVRVYVFESVCEYLCV